MNCIKRSYLLLSFEFICRWWSKWTDASFRFLSESIFDGQCYFLSFSRDDCLDSIVIRWRTVPCGSFNLFQTSSAKERERKKINNRLNFIARIKIASDTLSSVSFFTLDVKSSSHIDTHPYQEDWLNSFNQLNHSLSINSIRHVIAEQMILIDPSCLTRILNVFDHKLATSAIKCQESQW